MHLTVPNRGVAVVFALLAFVASGCTHATSNAQPGVELRIEQLPESDFRVEHRGAVSIPYQLLVHNLGTEPIRLRSVELKAAGRTPYTFRDPATTLDEVIEPGSEAVVALSLWVYPKSSSERSAWVTGKAVFERADSSFEVPIQQSFPIPE